MRWLALWVSIATMTIGCGPNVDDVASTDDAEDSGSEGPMMQPPTSTSSPTTGPDPDPDSDTDPDTDSDSDSDPTMPMDDTGPLEDHCTLDGPPAIAIGHGGGAFAPFETGPAMLVYGPQGGVHIDVALRGEHIDVSGAFVSEIRGYLDGAAVAVGNGGGGFVCDPATLYQLRDGILLIFELAPNDVHMQTFEVQATLTDSSGAMHQAAASVTVIDPMQ